MSRVSRMPRLALSILRLVLSMMRHDWIPGLCLVLSLAAVLCPLLLVLGLKHGTVSALRQRLLRDPTNLELRPMASVKVDNELLASLRRMDDVHFVLPTTRLLGSAVLLKADSLSVSIDLQPTSKGDPLLVGRRCPVPGAGEIVLSSSAAAKLGVTKVGSMLMVEVTRFKGVAEKASNSLRLVGILQAEATGLTTAYVPLVFQSQVEQFKDGLAVPELNWPGSLPLASPMFDGVAIFSAQQMPPVLSSRLCLETGFSTLKELPPESDENSLHPAEPGLAFGTLCFNPDNPQPESAVSTARDLLRGQSAFVQPWNQPLEAELSSTTLGTICGRLQVGANSAGGFSWKNSGTEPHPPVVFVHSAIPGTTAELNVMAAGRSLKLTVSLRHDSSISKREDFRTSPALTGALCLLRSRDLVWDEAAHAVLLGRRAYSSFRLYARRLEDVEPLRKRLAVLGMECRSESAQIARITHLDRDLSLIFWLISLFGMGGAGSALALSLYGAVERRRRDYGMLRTLGLGRRWLLLLPLLEAVLLALAAFFTGAGGFYTVAGFINRLFAGQSATAEAYCALPAFMLAGAGIFACLLAAAASLGAALRLTTISPADAIRSS